jgi:hypothetical protein
MAILGCDLRSLSQDVLAILNNTELLAVNQDPLGVQAIKVAAYAPSSGARPSYPHLWAAEAAARRRTHLAAQWEAWHTTAHRDAGFGFITACSYAGFALSEQWKLAAGQLHAQDGSGCLARQPNSTLVGLSAACDNSSSFWEGASVLPQRLTQLRAPGTTQVCWLALGVPVRCPMLLP